MTSPFGQQRSAQTNAQTPVHGLSKARLSKARLNKAKPHQAKPHQAKPHQAKPHQAGTPSLGPSSARPGFSLTQFLLVVSGASFIVIGVFHAPRHQHRHALSKHKSFLEHEIRQTNREAREARRQRRAFMEEQLFRESVLRRRTGQHPEGTLTIPEWLANPPEEGIQAPQ